VHQHLIRPAFGTEGEKRVVEDALDSQETAAPAPSRPPRAFDQRVAPFGPPEATPVLDHAKNGKEPSSEPWLIRWKLALGIKPIPWINDKQGSQLL